MSATAAAAPAPEQQKHDSELQRTLPECPLPSSPERPRRGKLRRQPVDEELIEAERLLEVLEPLRAEVVEDEARLVAFLVEQRG